MKAYNKILKSEHSSLIVKIKEQFSKDELMITINMGVNVENEGETRRLPLIGEVRLKFGKPNTNEIIN